jgi:hypothetical protein
MHLHTRSEVKLNKLILSIIEKDDALNQGVSATQTLINSAQTKNKQSQEVYLSRFNSLITSKSLERKKNAQEKLENENNKF